MKISELRPELTLIADWIENGSKVLDLGCGDGAFLAALREEKQVIGYGIEIDTDNIKACIDHSVNVIQSNIDDGLNDFEDDSFDYVIMSQTIQAVHHPHETIDDMLRVGGQGIITFPNMGNWKCRLQLALGKMPVTKHLPHSWYDTPNIHMCTVKDFDGLCRTRNISILERATLNAQHEKIIGMPLFPNLRAEIAVYKINQSLS